MFMSDRKYTDPSPEEIRALCLEIQATWDEETERLRRTGSRKPLPPAMIKMVRVLDPQGPNEGEGRDGLWDTGVDD